MTFSVEESNLNPNACGCRRKGGKQRSWSNRSRKGKPRTYVRPSYRAGANSGHTKILEQVTLLSQQKHNLKLIFPGWYAGRLREVRRSHGRLTWTALSRHAETSFAAGTWRELYTASHGGVLAGAWHGDYDMFRRDAKGKRCRTTTSTNIRTRIVGHRLVRPYAAFFHCDSRAVGYRWVWLYAVFFHCDLHERKV